jgi:multidrug efflux pump subunit AcrA (membrane-fusion protein)
MYIQAHIVVARHEKAIVVPPEMVITRNNRPVVFVLEDEKAVEREVEIGIETRDGVEIVSGLTQEDSLIVEGFETLRDGTPVRISQ